MSRSILAHLSFNFYRYYQADYAQFRSSARLFMARISPDHRSEFRPKIRAKEMSRSFLAHLSFNFYHSCQADYRHAQYRSSARLFTARISSVSRPEFSYGRRGSMQLGGHPYRKIRVCARNTSKSIASRSRISWKCEYMDQVGC